MFYYKRKRQHYYYYKTIKDRIIRDIGALFEKEDDYYIPIRIGNIWNNNYIEYESNSDKNKNLSLKEYLSEIKPYLGDIIINLQKSSTWKVRLTIAINFISSKDDDEEQVMHSNSDNIEFLIYYNANDVVDEHFFNSIQLLF